MNAGAGIALYVHWPFCLSKCPYCDFNSHAADAVDQGRWRAALLAELGHYAAETPGRRLASVFFGGGTPSLMAPETVAALVAEARTRWPPEGDVEVTLEANPSAAEKDRFAAYRDAGVNRLSLGVQSLDDDALAFLGRGHDAAAARAAAAGARAAFGRVSFDLIYARPGQTPDAWRGELAAALDLAGGHLSLYQLTIEAGTPFFRSAVAAADADLGAELFEITAEMTAAAGLPAYEISNHARPGAECRHNLACWAGADYVGVGPGAHGRLAGPASDPEGFTATHQIHDPGRWLKAVERNGHGTGKRRALTARERAEEMVMTGLRLTAGLDAAALTARTRLALADVIDAAKLAQLRDGGFLAETGGRLAATAKGRPVLDAVVGALLLQDPPDRRVIRKV